ncbi:hypothetical protein FDI40_gp348 [Agrobacterium phage Atu_ph07]|uniref:Uncharacterized protein n=1 Tax=Agrobacterium phage Atu_ph07 TaxID=2024264 RepID=A0A2L0UZZ6_9CAUD|nr:hypothetical protein FDI40_gp348 [Agrobacterium phage Atu_ph07]AUZ95107.1 hypothetical protein [Agrobacterium phage Atu_ph07]
MKDIVFWKQIHTPTSVIQGSSNIWVSDIPDYGSWIYCFTSGNGCKVSSDMTDFIPSNDKSLSPFEVWNNTLYSRTDRLRVVGDFKSIEQLVDLIGKNE